MQDAAGNEVRMGGRDIAKSWSRLRARDIGDVRVNLRGGAGSRNLARRNNLRAARDRKTPSPPSLVFGEDVARTRRLRVNSSRRRNYHAQSSPQKWGVTRTRQILAIKITEIGALLRTNARPL